MQRSLIVQLFLVLLLSLINDCLVHWDQHIEHGLVLILFVDFAGCFTRLAFNSRGKVSLNLFRVQVRVVTVVEYRVVAQSITKI